MLAWIEVRMPWLAYPTTIGTALFLHALMRDAGMSISLSSYVPVLIGAAMVTLLELRYPEERAWRPQGQEVRQDLLYMVTVQIVLARILGLVTVLLVADVSRDHPNFLWQLWPHDWPLPLQAALMMLVAEFLRYWLHVAAHNNPLLWRLHAVHHSPQRLYWLNVGRFHPLEKTLQYLFDALPFVLMGVVPEVIAMYFVFYAVNGFFQHSNIKLRYGILNYVVSSAELHRWHHSQRVEESNTNYGNNLILWDMLFGTRFLPRDRRVGDLGLKNRDYPMRFVEQLGTPFTPDIVERAVPLQGARRVLGRWVFWLTMQWVRVAGWWPLRYASQHPQSTQWKVLRRLLHENRATRFGQEHGFDQITSYEDFLRRVPVQDYEALRPYIEEQEVQQTPALTQTPPLMYAVTSGTTGQPKFLPVLSSTVKESRQEQTLLIHVLFRHIPMAFTGKMLGMVSPAVEGRRPSGRPYGSVSGHLYHNMPLLMRMNSVIPSEVYDIDDAEVKYRVMLRLALQAPDITYLAGANGSSFLRLQAVLNASRDQLADSLEHGTVAALGELAPDIERSLGRKLRRLPEVARRLRNLQHELTFNDFWPEIRLLTVWTGGSCGIAVEKLRRLLPPATRIVELGYLASEFRGTITVNPSTGEGVPTLHHHFFEFIETADWEAGRKQYLQLHQLQMDRDYYVIVTTGSGLYRYFMNDIVRVVGRFEATPTLRFVQKGKGVTSITGEKLYEGQLLQAVREVSARYGTVTTFVMALANEEDSVYELYLEPDAPPADARTMATELDARLGTLNIEYQSKRDSGRLAPLVLHCLKGGASEAFKEYCVSQGQREGQFKTIALQRKRDFPFDFSPYVANSSSTS